MAFESSAEQRQAAAAKQGGAGKRQEHGLSAPLTRDENGRFLGSGNPKGRPKKRKVPPATVAEACAQELMAPITVTQKGKTVTMSAIEILGKKLIADLVNGSPVERARALRSLEALGAFQALADLRAAEAEEQCGGAWTPELEAKYRLIEQDYSFEDDDAVGDTPQAAGTNAGGEADAPDIGQANEGGRDAGDDAGDVVPG